LLNISIRQLRAFVAVTRLGSFARAADELHVTPPAVTQQIREMEAMVGLPMFDRQGRKVVLTTAGEYFLVYARRLLAVLKEADDAMARLRRLEDGLLTVGMVSTAKYFVPRLLADFRLEHPGVDLRLQVTPTRDMLVTLLENGECDLAIMGRPPRELATRAEPFAAHPHVFVAPPGHPILRIGHPPASALVGHTLIAREGASGTRALMDRYFTAQRVEPRIAMEMPSNETIKQAVMAGMGLSFLSLHTLGLELRAGELALVEVVQAPVIRTWNVVHLQSRLLSPAAEALRYFILEEGEAFLAEHDRPWLQPR
jgi:DNA-binding transcriptional LysR family regulator